MQIDEAAVDEFIFLYQKEYGTTLSKEEAVEYGIRLIRFVKAVYADRLPETIDTEEKKENN